MADRAELEAYLQSRSIAYAPNATSADLEAQVLGVIDEEHWRYLQTYEAVVTRLPAAVGTAPEQPAEPEDESGAAPPGTADAPVPAVEQVELDEQAPPAPSEPVEPAASEDAAPEAASGDTPA